MPIKIIINCLFMNVFNLFIPFHYPRSTDKVCIAPLRAPFRYVPPLPIPTR
jgi:hypothetical protein